MQEETRIYILDDLIYRKQNDTGFFKK